LYMIVLICITAYVCFSYCILIGLIWIVNWLKFY
jgi:hypothetical protein